VYLTTNLKKLLPCIAIVGAWMCVPGAASAAGEKGELLLNRLGPVTSVLYVANADGSDEHRLLASRWLR
jgi:hypothetical protein